MAIDSDNSKNEQYKDWVSLSRFLPRGDDKETLSKRADILLALGRVVKGIMAKQKDKNLPEGVDVYCGGFAPGRLFCNNEGHLNVENELLKRNERINDILISPELWAEIEKSRKSFEDVREKVKKETAKKSDYCSKDPCCYSDEIVHPLDSEKADGQQPPPIEPVEKQKEMETLEDFITDKLLEKCCDKVKVAYNIHNNFMLVLMGDGYDEVRYYFDNFVRRMQLDEALTNIERDSVMLDPRKLKQLRYLKFTLIPYISDRLRADRKWFSKVATFRIIDKKSVKRDVNLDDFCDYVEYEFLNEGRIFDRFSLMCMDGDRWRVSLITDC